MSALLIGSLLVVLSAAVFGYALFGSRPVPQSATATDGVGSTVPAEAPVTERGHSEETTAFDRGDPWVRVPLRVRLRSALLLLLGAIGSAVVVGAAVGLLVVALILLVA